MDYSYSPWKDIHILNGEHVSILIILDKRRLDIGDVLASTAFQLELQTRTHTPEKQCFFQSPEVIFRFICLLCVMIHCLCRSISIPCADPEGGGGQGVRTLPPSL